MVCWQRFAITASLKQFAEFRRGFYAAVSKRLRGGIGPMRRKGGMELIRRLVDAKRMLLGQDVAATPAKPTQSDPSMPITWPRVAEHSLV